MLSSGHNQKAQSKREKGRLMHRARASYKDIDVCVFYFENPPKNESGSQGVAMVTYDVCRESLIASAQ